jgi:hypothetical protein
MTKRYVAVYRLTIGEISVFVFVLYVLLCFPVEHSQILVPFNIALYLWFLGGSALTVAGWICHKAILEIKCESKQESLNEFESKN